MIRFATAYSINERLFDAIDTEMNLCATDDWVCFTDGDTMFLQPRFGHIIQHYIEKYPDTGLFTCYASRCHYAWQLPDIADINNPSILHHRFIAKSLSDRFAGQVAEIEKPIAGHLMVIKGEKWQAIRDNVKTACASKQILGVDTKISRAVLAKGWKIRLMKAVYIMHYLRMAEGIGNAAHLKGIK